jgi:hypothetical protein
MPSVAKAGSIDEIVRSAIAPAVARASQAIARLIADLAAAELERGLTKRVKQSGPRRGRTAVRRRPPSEMTKWVADRSARRVPTFVIEATGLDTKKKIVAKFGENAAFEKGKPAPVTKASAAVAPEKAAPWIVKAKSPTIRKAAGSK